MKNKLNITTLFLVYLLLMTACDSGDESQPELSILAKDAVYYTENSELDNNTQYTPELTLYTLDQTGIEIRGYIEADVPSEDYFILNTGNYVLIEINIISTSATEPSHLRIEQGSCGYDVGTQAGMFDVLPNTDLLVHVSVAVANSTYKVQLKGINEIPDYSNISTGVSTRINTDILIYLFNTKPLGAEMSNVYAESGSATLLTSCDFGPYCIQYVPAIDFFGIDFISYTTKDSLTGDMSEAKIVIAVRCPVIISGDPTVPVSSIGLQSFTNRLSP